MIDTHAHLDLCGEPDAVMDRAREAGVTTVLTVGTSADSWAAVLELSGRHDGVHAILGVHPHNADGDEAARLDELRGLLADERVVGVGETGLDFYRDYAPRDAQRSLFAAQLELAAEAGKPVVVHSRAADEETARTLERFEGTVVLHCFSSPRLLPAALEHGYYVSFAGNLTFPNAAELRVAAAQVPSDRLLVETDAPYLAPQPRRGRPNEPAYVAHTLAALAAARRADEAVLEQQTEANARAAFRLP